MLPESEFTQPSAWCPAPGYWHSDTTDATEIEVSFLVAAFVTALQPELVVETGTNTGQTAELIGEALLNNGHGRLDTIETDPELHAQAQANTVDLPVRCILGSSLDYTPQLDENIDFAWFDSLLELRHVEIERFLPFFSEGACFGVHDTGPQHPTFEYLNRKLIPRGLITVLNLHTPRGVAFGQVNN